MIDWLEIRHFAIAEHIALEFGDAFTTVTGETGSGKSLIVDAVCILLGGRCDNTLIRQGQPQAEIQGGFALATEHPAMQWLRENQLDSADECILRRVVRRDKPSRAYINGRAVNASHLREIGRELVDVHSQHEHHALLRRKGQLALLDQAAGHMDAVLQLQHRYEQCTALYKQIAQLNAHRSTAQQRSDLLQAQIAELEALNPQADEWPKLDAQQKRMQHTHDLRTTAHAVTAQLLESSSGDSEAGQPMPVGAALSDCARRLEKLQEYDARLGKISAILEEAHVRVAEAGVQLKDLYAEQDFSAEEMAELEARFSSYHELSRKHNTLPGLLLEKLAEMRTELASLQNPQAELARLEKEVQVEQAEYDKLADAISEKRRETASRLEVAVTELMQDLGMAGGSFEIGLQPIAQDEQSTPLGQTAPQRLSRYGAESVEFIVSANPGQTLQPLGKVASGGELSRISLAINVIIAAAAPDSVLMLDEVDVGIGGKVAEIIGQKLRQLGRHRQVICITHLSQVAVHGQQHWSVRKHTGEDARVRVLPLNHQQRVEEIARMTAGAEVTPQSLAHAEQLLQAGQTVSTA